ncbi:MAG TPA: hypothetical protein VGL23_07210 [Chloroflexota bacterium]
MDGSIVVALLAGAAGGALLLAGRALSMRVDPRPCWEKNDCALKRANPEACQACPIYLYRDRPAEQFLTMELNLPPLRRFEPDAVEAA